MFHPLAPNLSELSNEDLHKKYNDLMNRLNQAYRFGPMDAVGQIQMLLSHYNEEIQTRNRKQMEELEKTSKRFKNIIDVK